ncbi:basic proline-rich protein-like [Oenanthe melanoleuca]|uniref:basic proline-rich protein-like n=1 Tax=Oenanthe melanoleuca TaxID=2939378 RepID=UPI0024C11151|nr:basic proline-rich protein-like [Oenanthe melanoleuca]
MPSPALGHGELGAGVPQLPALGETAGTSRILCAAERGTDPREARPAAAAPELGAGKTSPCGQRGIRAPLADIGPGWRERPRLGGASGSAAVNSAGTASGARSPGRQLQRLRQSPRSALSGQGEKEKKKKKKKKPKNKKPQRNHPTIQSKCAFCRLRAKSRTCCGRQRPRAQVAAAGQPRTGRGARGAAAPPALSPDPLTVPVPPRDPSRSSDRSSARSVPLPPLPLAPRPRRRCRRSFLAGLCPDAARSSPRGDPAPRAAGLGCEPALRPEGSAAFPRHPPEPRVLRDVPAVLPAPPGTWFSPTAPPAARHPARPPHPHPRRRGAAHGLGAAPASLYGQAAVEGFAQKFVGVGHGGIPELHGRSWTLPGRRCIPAAPPRPRLLREALGQPGLNLRVLDGGTARLLPHPPAAGAALSWPGALGRPQPHPADAAAAAGPPGHSSILLRYRRAS